MTDSKTHRWNIEQDGSYLLVCFGDHEKHDGCQWVRFVSTAALIRARDAALEEAAKLVDVENTRMLDHVQSGLLRQAATAIRSLKNKGE